MLKFEGIGPLPAFSAVVIHVDNMLNASGKPLEGLTSATYIEPDFRPVVTGLWTTVNNEDGTLEATSSKPGTIYLIRFNGDYNYIEAFQTVDDLDSAVLLNQGRKVDAPLANTPATISTRGLPGGYYIYFAVDEEGRISEPADEWPQVEETGPLLENHDDLAMPGFTVWSQNGTIFIQPDDQSEIYSVRIFDMTGRLIHMGESTMGDQHLSVQDDAGIVFIRLMSATGISVGTRKLFRNPAW